MISVYLRTEIASVRFRVELESILVRDGWNRSVIETPNIESAEENEYRRRLICEFRGYNCGTKMFEGFPNDVQWYRTKITRGELFKVLYIDYDYWVELSNGTRIPREAAKTIRQGVDIFGVSSQGFMPLARAVRAGASFPELILVSKDERSYLVVMEGNARLTAYALEPDSTPDTLLVIVGYSPDIESWGLY